VGGNNHAKKPFGRVQDGTARTTFLAFFDFRINDHRQSLVVYEIKLLFRVRRVSLGRPSGWEARK